jgi:galactonate dehydratase
MPHNPLGPICTAATIHLAAAVPNFAWLEVQTTVDGESATPEAEWFPLRPVRDGTCFPVSNLPGLGVEFDEERAREQAFEFWEAPHLRRRDGSHTNW